MARMPHPPGNGPDELEPDEDYLDDDEEDGEGFDDEAEEPGRGPSEPDTRPVVPPPRGPAKPRGYGVPLGDVEAALRTTPSGETRASINAITSRLAALGPGLRFRVKRLEPRLPVCESGMSDWIDIENPSPTEDDLIARIRELKGGGRYYVVVRSRNNQRVEEDVIPDLPIDGDWKPTTQEGAILREQMYRNGGVMPTGLPSAAALTDPNPLLRDVLTQAADDKKHAREIEERARASADSTAVQLVTALRAQGGGGGNGSETLAAVLGAIAPIAQALIQGAAENRRAAEERAAEERRRSEERFEKLIAEMRATVSPTGHADAVASMLRMQEKFAEARLNEHMSVSKKVTDHAIEIALAAAKGPGEEPVLRTAFAKMIEAAGPQLGASVAQMLPALVGAGQPQPGAPAPAVAGAPVMAPGATQAPVFLPVAPPAPPAPPAPAAEPAPPAAEPAAPEAAPPAPPPEPDLATTARQGAERAATLVLYQLRIFLAGEPPDPVAAWEVKPDGSHSIETLVGLAPRAFRAALAQASTNPAAPVSPAAWTAGMGATPAGLSAALEAAITSDSAAREWLRAWLDEAPWNEPQE